MIVVEIVFSSFEKNMEESKLFKNNFRCQQDRYIVPVSRYKIIKLGKLTQSFMNGG